ncbi:MAG: hypothetical protein ACKD6N_02040 [Candidatus Bathyarchaeota archaeon]
MAHQPEVAPFASPAVAALGAVTMASFCFFALLTGLVEQAGSYIYLSALCIIAGAVQMIAGVIDLRNKDIVNGGAMLLFGGCFILVAGVNAALTVWGETAGVHATYPMMGWGVLAGGLCLIMITPAYFYRSSILSIFMIDADLALLALGIGFIAGNLLFVFIGGVLLLILALIGLYLILATCVNVASGRMVLPFGNPILKPKT